MQNLGNKIVFILLIASQAMYAGVVASVDRERVGYGEAVTYNLTLSGEDVKRPEIYTLCGEDVVATGSSTSIKIVNGNYQKSYVLSYKFIAKKSCTIDSISLDLDGKIQKTEAIDIVVEKVVASKDDNFLLTMSTNKKEVYVGEPFELTLLFKQRKSAQVVDNKFAQPDFKGFWVKGEPTQEVVKEQEYINTKIIYKMASQREGSFLISPAQISIASRQNTKNFYGGFFPEVKWKNYFSNDVNITSKARPNGIDFIGDLNIEASASVVEVNANEAVNVTIKVSGEGNLEDIKSFKPYVNGVSVFDEKILIKDNVLTQKITFVGENDFTIPSFSLKVFNPMTKETKTISTKAIDIKVNNSKTPKDELTIKREKKSDKEIVKEVVSEKLDTLRVGIIFLSGLVFGILLMLLKPFLSFKREKKLDVKDHKMLLVKLMPFKENEDVTSLVDILENNLYKDEKQELDKKLLKEILKKYEIS